jgi:hypothetical protein
MGQTGTKVGFSEPAVLNEIAAEQQLKGTVGITE